MAHARALFMAHVQGSAGQGRSDNRLVIFVHSLSVSTYSFRDRDDDEENEKEAQKMTAYWSAAPNSKPPPDLPNASKDGKMEKKGKSGKDKGKDKPKPMPQFLQDSDAMS